MTEVIDEQAARGLVEEILATWPPRPGGADEEVVVWRTEEHERAWVVFYATRRWIQTRDFRQILVGTSPFIVEKANGEVHLYGSAPSEMEKFESWLDVES